MSVGKQVLKFSGFMWNPLSWVMEAAALITIGLANGGVRIILTFISPPTSPLVKYRSKDHQTFLCWHHCLAPYQLHDSFIEENNDGNASAAIMARLVPKAKVLRDGKWSEEKVSVLVPGDVVSIKLGDIIPADARLMEGDHLKIDQFALTRESLPLTKNRAMGSIKVQLVSKEKLKQLL